MNKKYLIITIICIIISIVTGYLSSDLLIDGKKKLKKQKVQINELFYLLCSAIMP